MRLGPAKTLCIALIMCVPFSACGSDSSKEPAASNNVGRVVALGDSDPAASGLSGADPEANSLCFRTIQGYPRLAAESLGATEYVDATCASATIPDLSSSQKVNGVDANSPQLDSLNGKESVVTLTIGDNDAAVTEVWTNCLQSDYFSSPTPCKDHFGENGMKAKADSIATPLANLLDEIHKRSPQARVFLVGYQRVLPDELSSCPGRVNVTAADAPMVTAWQQEVADVQKRVASEHKTTYVDLFSASAPGTDACADPATSWVNPMINPTGWRIHPTLNGQKAAAQKLVAAVKGQAG